LQWKKLIRQVHRWLSIAFTLAVIVNVIAMMQEKQAVWVGILALFPLVLLMISGLYMFALPYFATGGAGRALTGERQQS
jgi:membrane protein CcdC involved in cytochrome C biogenesis